MREQKRTSESTENRKESDESTGLYFTRQLDFIEAIA